MSAGCGLTNRDVEPLPEGEAGEPAGAAIEPSSSGGAPTAGTGAAGDASAHVSSGGADRGVGSGAAAAGGEGAASAVPVLFKGKPGGPAAASAESAGLTGTATIDGSAPRGSLNTSERELCVETELAGEDDYMELFLRVGQYDASAQGVTGFAFDLSVEPAAAPKRFWVGATYLGRHSVFRGDLAAGATRHSFHFDELAYEVDGERVVLDADYQQRISMLVWDIGGTGTPTPTTFCVKNLVLLRD